MSSVFIEKPASAVVVGEHIRFRTISPHDTTIYTGQVISIGNYAVAKIFGDVAAIHQDMLQQNPELVDVSLLKYLIVECHDKKRRPFAIEWIQDGKVSIVETGNTKLIRIYNTSPTNIKQIIALLRQNDITCSIVD